MGGRHAGRVGASPRLGRWLLPGLAALAFAGSGRAQAQERPLVVVVLPFRGARAEVVRADVVEAVQAVAGVRLLPPDQVRNAAAALGLSLRRLDEAGRARLARQLRAEALVGGRIGRKRKRRRREWVLTLTVWDAEGRKVGALHWRGRSFGRLRAVRRSASRRLGPLLEEARGRSAAARQGAATGGRAWYGAAAGSAAGGGQAGGAADAAHAGADLAEPSEPVGDEPPEPPEQRPAAPLRAVEVALQAGVLSRSLSTEANVLRCVRERTCSAADPFGGPTFVERREYSSAGLGHGELGLSMAVFPGAIEASQPLPWLGLYGAFSHSVGLRTTGPACSGHPDCPRVDVVDVRSRQLQMQAGLRFRLRPDLGARRARFETDVGWGRLLFDFDLDDLSQLDRSFIVPPFDYQWVEFGLRGGIDLVPDLLELKGEGALRLVYDQGQAARDIWGRTASTSAWTVAAALRVALPFVGDGAFAELRAEWAAFSTTFSEQTSCFRGDCPGGVYDLWEPWPQDAAGRATGLPKPVPDTYRRLALRVGYAWGPGGGRDVEALEARDPERASPGDATPGQPATWPPPASETPGGASGNSGAWWAQ